MYITNYVHARQCDKARQQAETNRTNDNAHKETGIIISSIYLLVISIGMLG